MKIIRHGYDPIARVDCSCCMEEHTTQFSVVSTYNKEKDLPYFDDYALYIKIEDASDFSFSYRLKHAIDFIKNWKSYIDGENITSHGIIIHHDQIKELYSVLKDGLLKHNILTPEELIDIEREDHEFPDRKFPIHMVRYNPNKRFNKKTKYTPDDEWEWVPFVGDDFVVSLDIEKDKDRRYIREIIFGYKLYDRVTKKNVRRMAWRHLRGDKNFLSGCEENFMSKTSAINFLKFLYYFTSTTN